MDGDYKIDDELSLFTVSKTDKFYSPANKSLYDEKGKDTFRHEQNLIISENRQYFEYSNAIVHAFQKFKAPFPEK